MSQRMDHIQGRFSFLLLLIVLLTLSSSCAGQTLILGNAKIYTVDEANPWAEALAIDSEGTIVSVGSESEVTSMFGADADYVDMNQRLVLPGFQDVHLHAVEAGIFQNLCYIPEDIDMRDVPFIFDDECENGGVFGDQGWIMGSGIDINLLWSSLDDNPNMNYPITILDNAYPNTPVLIIDNLGHGVIANSRAFEIVGFDLLTGNPPGGIIDRDPVTNGPTGIVLENAQQPLRDAAFPPTRANMDAAYQGLLWSLDRLAANGITSVSDAGGFGRQAQTQAWARAEANDMLTVRASNCLYIYPDQPIEDQMEFLMSRFTNDPNALVRFNQAKIYVDGIFSLATAALYNPYLESLELPAEFERGFEYFGDQETLTNVAQTLTSAGFQLMFHVIGDRAAGLALNAIEAATVADAPFNHRLTHVYLVAKQDKSRFASLGVVADFQLSRQTASLPYRNFLANDLIGSERANSLIPVLEMFEAGAMVVISSDWDTDRLSPLFKLSTLLARPDGRSLPDLETALPMMTLNAAKVLQHDDKTGSIEVGKFADLVVLDRDIFAMNPRNIKNAKVVATLLQGDPVYDIQGLFGTPQGLRSPAPSASPPLGSDAWYVVSWWGLWLTSIVSTILFAL